jgi:hypothetical protein
MGHVNAHMVLGALSVMQAGMEALGIEHGPGALEAAARALSDHAPAPAAVPERQRVGTAADGVGIGRPVPGRRGDGESRGCTILCTSASR